MVSQGPQQTTKAAPSVMPTVAPRPTNGDHLDGARVADLGDCEWTVNMQTGAGEPRRVTVRADSEQGACFAAEELYDWCAISARPRDVQRPMTHNELWLAAHRNGWNP